MVDTIILRLHNLSKYNNLIKRLELKKKRAGIDQRPVRLTPKSYKGLEEWGITQQSKS